MQKSFCFWFALRKIKITAAFISKSRTAVFIFFVFFHIFRPQKLHDYIAKEKYFIHFFAKVSRYSLKFWIEFEIRFCMKILIKIAFFLTSSSHGLLTKIGPNNQKYLVMFLASLQNIFSTAMNWIIRFMSVHLVKNMHQPALLAFLMKMVFEIWFSIVKQKKNMRTHIHTYIFYIYISIYI